MTPRTATPDRSLEQRLSALSRANEIRVKRAALKQSIRAGHVQVDTLLLRPPDYLQSARIMDFLMAVPGLGTVKVNRLLKRSGASPSKTFAGLSDRQRTELVRALRRSLERAA